MKRPNISAPVLLIFIVYVAQTVVGERRILLATDKQRVPYNYAATPRAEPGSLLRRFAKDAEASRPEDRRPVGDKVFAVGSTEPVFGFRGDLGFFGAVLHAYDQHLVLRTSPDDWWFTIVNQVALAIDSNSKKETVRRFFVAHEGKKKITVTVGPPPLILNSLNYSSILGQFARKIKDNINLPRYVDAIQSDFSTSGFVHKIGTNAVLMSSVQEYFEYTIGTSCGIPAVEMKGSMNDWRKLREKVKSLQKMLEPIKKEIGLDEWWTEVTKICDNLIKTFRRNPDTDWWSHIFSLDIEYGSGGGTFYNGWFLNTFLRLEWGTESLAKVQSGVTAVPLKLKDQGIEESAAFVAGISGFEVTQRGTAGLAGDWDVVEAVHGWALLVDRGSAFLPASSRSRVGLGDATLGSVVKGGQLSSDVRRDACN